VIRRVRALVFCVLAMGSSEAGLAMTPAPAASPEVVSLSCDYDYRGRSDVRAPAIDARSLRPLISRCASAKLIHVYYKGETGRSLKTLIRTVSDLAAELAIPRKILDIDSIGGDVDEAMQAGDIIGDTDWDVWVGKGRQCLSACVLIVAAGGDRSVNGTLGVHRLFPALPRATTRRQLQAEISAMTERMKAYLRVQGVNPTLADVMATVPANTIRTLTEDEARDFGLLGQNAADADLSRAHLVRKCGWNFVNRKEAWSAAASRCVAARGAASESSRTALQCQLDLAKQFGFPDLTCPDESPDTDLKRLLSTANHDGSSK
jgi:hypothetical protein